MRKACLIILALLMMVALLASCTHENTSTSISETVIGTPVETTARERLETTIPTAAETTENEPVAPSILDLGDVMNLSDFITRLVNPSESLLAEFGLWSFCPLGIEDMDYTFQDAFLNELYCLSASPDGQFVLYRQLDTDGKRVMLLVYDVGGQEILQAYRTTSGEPVYYNVDWSADSSLAVLSDYMPSTSILLFDANSKTIRPVSAQGSMARISPDASRIIYTDLNREDHLYLYDFKSGQEQLVGDGIRGSSPIWFSDSRRILFTEYTGDNPFGLEGGELKRLSVLDLSAPDLREDLLDPAVFRAVSWIEQDRLVLIHSGWDDGFFTGVLDLDTQAVLDFGENQYSIISGDDAAFAVYDTSTDDIQLIVYDNQLNLDACMPIHLNQERAFLTDMHILPSRQVFCVLAVYRDNPDEYPAEYGVLVDLENDRFEPIFDMTGYQIRGLSADGSRLVLTEAVDHLDYFLQVVIVNLVYQAP